MKRVFSATEYKRALMPLSPEERQRIASAVAEAARAEAEERNASCVILLCCGGFMEEIAALTAKGLEGMGLIAKIACLGRDDLPALAGAIACDFLLFADGTAPKARWVEALQRSSCPVISLGIPAGVDPDTGVASAVAVQAVTSIAPLGYLKGLFFQDGLDHCGRIRFIGPEAKGEGVARFEAEDAVRLLPPRKRTAHKGDSGKALLCVGSPKYVGAALLSARACLAAGCGILYVACPREPREALYSLPEAIGISVGKDWDGEGCQRAIDALSGKQAVGIGCGAGDGDISLLLEAALETKLPTVLDADGLNCLSRHRELYGLLHEKVVLTPHPGEMGRLLGVSSKDVLADPLQTAKDFAAKWGCVVLLKGAATVVSDGRRTRIVAEGNAGLGKGGSGDVLTGIIAALLSQGIKPFDGACLGSFLLGTSADKAFALLKERMLRASNVIEALERI